MVVRDGKERTITVEVGVLTGDKEQAAAGSEAGTSADKLGLTVQPLTADNARDLGYEGETGVVIGEVKDDSPAATAELRPGDLITEINREKISSVAEFRAALDKAKDKDSILFLVKSKAGSRFVIVRVK